MEDAEVRNKIYLELYIASLRRKKIKININVYDNIGFPRKVPDIKWQADKKIYTSPRDINMIKAINSFKSHLKSGPRSWIFDFFQVPTLNESLNYVSQKVATLKRNYERTRASLEDIIKSKCLKCIHDTGMKNMSV